MSVTEQQQRALVFLAIACRPHGARRWQEAGVAAAVAKIAHMSLPDVAMAVLRAAADRNAETPGVIPSRGPHWSEGTVTPAWEPEVIPASERCSVCSRRKGDCERVRFADDDHTFEPAAMDRKRDPEVIRQIVEATKAEVELTKAPVEPAPVPVDPNVEALRGVLSAPDTHHTIQETQQ